MNGDYTFGAPKKNWGVEIGVVNKVEIGAGELSWKGELLRGTKVGEGNNSLVEVGRIKRKKLHRLGQGKDRVAICVIELEQLTDELFGIGADPGRGGCAKKPRVDSDVVGFRSGHWKR